MILYMISCNISHYILAPKMHPDLQILPRYDAILPRFWQNYPEISIYLPDSCIYPPKLSNFTPITAFVSPIAAFVPRLWHLYQKYCICPISGGPRSQLPVHGYYNYVPRDEHVKNFKELQLKGTFPELKHFSTSQVSWPLQCTPRLGNQSWIPFSNQNLCVCL